MMEELTKLASEYEETVYGEWLREFSWRAVPVEFRDLPFGIVGMQRRGRIVLKKSPEAALIFDIYIHELRHVWQRQKHPARYLTGLLFRPLIERDADAEEAQALDWLERRTK